jgi:hypothetical protein
MLDLRATRKTHEVKMSMQVRESNSVVAAMPTKDEFEILKAVAKMAADSKYFEKLGGEAGVFCIGMYAWEIGVPPMTAIMGGFSNVQGKITMSAELMNNLIRQKGHRLEILESSSTICRIKGTRKDTGESYTASFTIEDAKRAGLVKSGGGYDKHSEDMLFARAIGRLKRRLFPDVASKAYVDGELDDPIESEIINVDSRTGEVKQIELIEPITHEQEEIIERMIGDDTEYTNRILGHYKIDDFSKLPQSQYPLVIEKIKKRNEQKLKDEMSNRVEVQNV